MSGIMTPKYVKAGNVYRFLGWFSLILCFLLTVLTIFCQAAGIDIKQAFPVLVFFITAFGLMAVLELILGKAIKAHKTWGRIAGSIYGFALLAGFPIFTLFGLYILHCLVYGWDEQTVEQNDPPVELNAPPEPVREHPSQQKPKKSKVFLFAGIAIAGYALFSVGTASFQGYLQYLSDKPLLQERSMQNKAKSSYYFAINRVKSEYAKGTKDLNFIRSIVADLNRIGKKSPYNPRLPAFLEGVSVKEGQVALSETEAAGVDTARAEGGVLIQVDWTGDSTPDSSTIVSE